MANQITHIVLNEKVFPALFSQFNEREFYMGSVFPDIRYLGTIKREQTHFVRPTIQQILALEDSFEAGMQYHSLVDETRERFMVEAGIYDLMPESKHRPSALKCLEDELYYSEVSRWPDIIQYFDTTLPQETARVDKDVVLRWHTILQRYFAAPPSDATRHQFILDLIGSEEIAAEIATLVHAARTNTRIVEAIRNMLIQWPSLIAKNFPHA